MSEREEFIAALRRTKKLFGTLYPVIKTPDGTIIDGIHRLEADPDWPTQTVELEHPYDAIVFRIIANMVRRDVSAEEKSEALGELAEATGWAPKEIAENLGASYRWVMKYLPDKYKERPGAGGPRVVSRATQEEEVFIEEHPTVRWILHNSTSDINYRTNIPRLTDEELDFCLEHEKRVSGWEQLRREKKKREEPPKRRKPTLEEEARKLGIEIPRPTVPRVQKSMCPLCGSSVAAEVLSLKFEEFKYGEPELTVKELMERSRKR